MSEKFKKISLAARGKTGVTRCVRSSNCYYGLDRPDATNFKKKPKFGVVTSPIWSISQHQSLVEPHIEGFGNPLATFNTTHTV